MSAVIQNEYTGNGSTTTYSFTFPYLKTSDIKASLDGVETAAFTLPTATTLQFNTAPSNGAKIKIFRKTGIDTLTATFYAGSAIKSEDLNDNFTQNLYSTQEFSDRGIIEEGGTINGNLTIASSGRIKFQHTDAANAGAYGTLVGPSGSSARTYTLPSRGGKFITTDANSSLNSTECIEGDMINDDVINSQHYVDGSIDTAHIADLQVTTAKIANDAVTADKLAHTSVTAGTYSLANITVDAQGRITAAADGTIATDAITTAKIANDAVTGAKIAHDTITFQNLADDCVLRDNISNYAVNTDRIANGSITTDKIATTAVTGQKIATGAVTHSKLGASSVIHDKLGTNAVETNNIDTYAVTNAKIADNAVGTAKIMDNAVTSAKLANEPLVFANFTTTERDALSSTLRPNGSVIFNTTTNKLQVRVGSSWIDLH